jgi:hypothetical protein
MRRGGVVVSGNLRSRSASNYNYRIVWYGCLDKIRFKTKKCSTNFDDVPIMADSPTEYRHFAVDTSTVPEVKKIIYYCDRNPYRSGMFCYCSDRQSAGEGNTWSGNFMLFLSGLL